MKEDILEIVNNSHLTTLLQGSGSIPNHIKRYKTETNRRCLTFTKIKFGIIEIATNSISDIFIFEECSGEIVQIKAEAEFKACNFQEINAEKNISEVIIKDCKIETLRAGIKSTVTQSKIEDLITTQDKYQESFLSLTNSQITQSLKIDKGILSLQHSGSFIEKIIYGDIDENIELDGINVRNIELKYFGASRDNRAEISIKNIDSLKTFKCIDSSIKHLILNKCKVGEFFIDNKHECKQFQIKDSYINELLLNRYDLQKLTIEGNTNISLFLWKLSSSKIKNLQLRSGDTYVFPLIKNLICIDGNIPSDADISFSDCGIGSIIFWKVTVQGKLTFSNVLGANLIVPTDYQEQNKQIELNECIENCKSKGLIPNDLKWHWGIFPRYAFFIIDTDLGKTIFNSCSFTEMDLYMVGVKVIDVNITDSHFPEQLYLPPKAPLGSSRIAYAQLRKMHENRGDTIKANMYQAHELNAYYESLRWLKKGAFWEKFNLSLNKYTNYFGQNYVRAFLVTIGMSAILYTIYCMSLGFVLDIKGPNTWNNFKNISGNFLEFLNPIHKADFIAEALLGIKEPKDVPSSARSIEVASRVFNSYFIYQFVQAFRKYGKK
jgi:hypothetical protein